MGDQWALVTDAYLLNSNTHEFLRQHNPNALKEMAERLLEAIQRGLWSEPGDYAQALEDIILDVEQGLEGGG